MVGNLIAAGFFIGIIIVLVIVGLIEAHEYRRDKAQQAARARLRELENDEWYKYERERERQEEAEKVWPIDDVGL